MIKPQHLKIIIFLLYLLLTQSVVEVVQESLLLLKLPYKRSIIKKTENSPLQMIKRDNWF